MRMNPPCAGASVDDYADALLVHDPCAPLLPSARPPLVVGRGPCGGCPAGGDDGAASGVDDEHRSPSPRMMTTWFLRY